MEDTQEAELRNPFPSPPSHYTNYSAHNLQLLSLLRERTDVSELTQTEILSDQNDVPEWPLASLEKPRVDWIREEGYYNVFGDTWFVRLAQYSVARVMYDSPSSSKRPSPLLERWAVISCTQRTPPQVRCFCCCLPSDLTNPLWGPRPTPRALVHSKIHARHVFVLSGCTPCPAAERSVERAPRMASPGGVDHRPRTKRHGCRE